MTIASTKTRRRIEYEYGEIACSGDLIYRYGDARHFEAVLFKKKNIRLGVEISFSKMLIEVPSPVQPDPYSHVAVIQVMAPGDVRVWDMSDEGLRRFELRDWMRETHHGGQVEIRRLRKNHTLVGEGSARWLEDLRDEKDPNYDFEFEPEDGQFYCAEAANASYLVQGIEMPDLVDLSKQPGWKMSHKLIAWKGGIQTKVVLPGSTEQGMRSSPLFRVVYLYEGEKNDSGT